MSAKTIPNEVTLFAYHFRHVAVTAGDGSAPIYQAMQSFGAEHAAAITGKPLTSPTDQCKAWLKEHGFTFKTGDDFRSTWIRA